LRNVPAYKERKQWVWAGLSFSPASAGYVLNMIRLWRLTVTDDARLPLYQFRQFFKN